MTFKSGLGVIQSHFRMKMHNVYFSLKLTLCCSL